MFSHAASAGDSSEMVKNDLDRALASERTLQNVIDKSLLAAIQLFIEEDEDESNEGVEDHAVDGSTISSNTPSNEPDSVNTTIDLTTPEASDGVQPHVDPDPVNTTIDLTTLQASDGVQLHVEVDQNLEQDHDCLIEDQNPEQDQECSTEASTPNTCIVTYQKESPRRTVYMGPNGSILRLIDENSKRSPTKTGADSSRTRSDDSIESRRNTSQCE